MVRLVLVREGVIADHGGTTDTTRTLVGPEALMCDEGLTVQHFGQPSDEEKRAFTRVLQGHIGEESVYSALRSMLMV